MDQHEAEKTPIDDVTEEKREYRRVRMLSHQKSVSTDSESEAEDANELPNRKVIILGDSETGKTSLLIRFDQDRFCEGGLSATVGVGYANKVVDVDDSKIKLQIWDTAGQERFRSITRAYYRDAEALLLVYDITNRKSYDNIKSWLTEISELAKNDVIIMVIGNKADLISHRQVSKEEGMKIAQDNGAVYTETSAKDGENVEFAFTTLARELKSMGLPNSRTDNQTRLQNSKTNKSSARCCV